MIDHVPDSCPTNPDRYYLSVFEEWFPGGWKPSISLFDSRANPPLVVQYCRIEP